ncbi:MAG: class II glutamine amidotransferase [Candidatus Bathyarchaeia archaeon]|nr:class II glutamine amidotransferase [Candidatus Bathyarchaeota archaeon]
MRLQGDGWGIGFYANGSLEVIRSDRPVYEERGRFMEIAESVKSNIIVAHIRRASNPRGLPREKLISIENSQPFYYRNFVFVHNGVIMIPDEIAELLGEWRLRVRGLNDSEVYFWYIVKEVHEGRSVREALKNFEGDLYRVWFRVHDKCPSKARPYMGLNMIFSDGEKLYAFCKYDEEVDGAIRSLCYGDQPGMRMMYIAGSDKFIVSSEMTNLEDDWRPFENGQLIIAQAKNGKISLTKMEI